MKNSTMKRSGFATPTGMLSQSSFQRKAAPAEKKRRTRKCAILTCRQPFVPRSMTHKTCGPDCAQAFVAQEKARKLKSERQAGLRKLMRKADYVEEAQKAFNSWVRFRDRDLPCICCGKFAAVGEIGGGRYDAGHYLSRGSHPHLKFDERNCFKQRKGCNRPGGTTAAAFRLGVIARIGLQAVEALESDNEPRHYTIADLIALKAHYKAKLKELKAEAT